MNQANLWETIVTTALVGSDRQPFKPVQLEGALGTFLQRLQPSGSETLLLGAAAVMTLHQQVGQVPAQTHHPVPHPCDREDLPHCSRRAEDHLRSLLSGERMKILPEWLAACVRAGQRIPETSLPEVLQLGRQHPHLREAIAPALGKRGQWLATQNPEWQYASGQLQEGSWETGTRATRLQWLRQGRSRHPDQAREQLMMGWKKESAGDRAAFLEVLQTGLSMADEPFLETVLDDRSKEVRRVAVKLLAQLPESQFCQRMLDRMKPLVQIVQTKEQTRRISIHLPHECDAAMQRDGIDFDLPTGWGKKTWWLFQIMRSLPCRYWETEWNTTIGELAEIVQHSDSKKLFLNAWMEATVRCNNALWAQTLFPYYTISHLVELLSNPEILVLFKLLLTTQQEALIMNLLEQSDTFRWRQFDRENLRSSYSSLLVDLLLNQPQAWNSKLFHHLLSKFQQATAKVISYYTLENMFSEIAFCIPVSLISEVASLKQEVPNHWQTIINDGLSILQFRQEMLDALGTPHPPGP